MTEITPFTFPTTGQAVRTLLGDGAQFQALMSEEVAA